MTRKEKESLIKHLETVVPITGVVGEANKELWYVSDVKAAISDFVEDNERKAGLNYEAEYKRLVKANSELEHDLHHWQTVAAQKETELEKLRLIIRTIEFVSGRELNI